jgi:hypothetical protein
MAKHFLVATLVAFTCNLSAPSFAQETEIIAGGELEYLRHCAACHGSEARGHGAMSEFLTISPPDLTLLRKNSGGTFPFWRVYRVIDGREDVKGHGTREMPLWGSRFQAEGGSGSREQAAGRILGLVFYLQYLQRD